MWHQQFRRSLCYRQKTASRQPSMSSAAKFFVKPPNNPPISVFHRVPLRCDNALIDTPLAGEYCRPLLSSRLWLWNQGLVTLANLARGFCVSGLKLVSGTDKFMPTGVNNNSQRWLEIIGKLVRKLYCVSLRQTPSSDCAHGHNARQNDLEAGLGTRRYCLNTY